MAERQELTITRVGAQGDGVAEAEGRAPIFVAFTLAGEVVRAEVTGERGRLCTVLTPSADRVAPVCQHFGACGGCALQHMSRAAYATFKQQQVAAAFASRGFHVSVDAIVQPGGARRRAVLSAARDAAGVLQLGYHEAHAHTLIDLAQCPVLHPAIVATMPKIRQFLEPLLSRKGDARLTVTMTNAGLDVGVDGIEKVLSADLRAKIAKVASGFGWARVTFARDVVFEALTPALTFGSAEVPLPPAVFVQAVAEAEAEMARRVVAAVGKAKTVVDLFSGLGAFTFPLAARARVSAFDSDRDAIAALTAATKRSTGLKPIAARPRDLFREPLSALELNEHEAIVFDPPRAGAEAQARMIAKSKVKTVVAVSCNPATLARDARVLVDGGYKIESITPIDQFVYSPHIEAVAVFRR